MSRSGERTKGKRSSFSTLAAFMVGIPVGCGVLLLLGNLKVPEVVPGAPPPPPNFASTIHRYIEHPVEKTEVIMFCCAIVALLVKAFGWALDKAAFKRDLLPEWNGEPIPVAEAGKLRQQLDLQPPHVQNTYLGKRVAGVLEFVESRGSANELDDQLRGLSDADVMAQDSSYSLLRLITWAVPILGFLGTVLGITQAISGVTPEMLEKSMSTVTDGLATAFDTTAMALFLTMILMFLSSMVQRLEQGILENVDQFVDAELTHRFERTGPESSQFIDALRQNTQVLLKTTEQLVEKQALLWARSLDKADRAWTETGNQQQEKISAGLHDAMEATLARHSQRLAQVEERLLSRNQALVEGIHKVAEALSKQTESLARLQEGETQLLRLQESLNQNLSTLANTGTFEQAVQSLTAAIHLMTTRVGGNQPAAGPRLAQRPAA